MILLLSLMTARLSDVRRVIRYNPAAGAPETNITARPIADLDNTGSWTTEPLWSDINGVIGSDDTDFISVTGNGAVRTMDASTTLDPEASSGHILRIRVGKASEGANYDIWVELRQGYVSEAAQGTLIAINGATNYAGPGPTTFSRTLTSGEADAITDYSDLQFRLGQDKGGGAGRENYIYDVELEVEAP